MPGLALRINCPGERDFRLQLDCELPARGITAVYGPSGSGKSTLLDCIAGLRQPGADAVIRFGSKTWQAGTHFTAPWDRRVGYVFQDARLFPHLNVQQNLDYALTRRPTAGEISPDKVIAWLELEDLLASSPAALSAGQKQRVAIGRALLGAPRLLLLDEPLANLDHAASQQCLACLQRLADALDLPMLYVSHDIEEVSQLADYLVLLEQGQLVDQGSMLQLCSRLDTRLSHEEQAATIVVGTVRGHDTQFGLTELEMEGNALLVNQLTEPVGAACRLRIPARDVSLCRHRASDSSILNILPVEITEIEQTDGTRVLLRLALGGQYLLARITRKSVAELNLKVGDSLYAQIKSVALLSEALEYKDES